MDRNETIATIKKSLQERSGKTWSVTGGRGTAWGWIRISVPPSRLGCDRRHNFAAPDYNDCPDCGGNRFEVGYAGCPAHICNDDCYTAYIVPDEAAELGKLLGLGKPVHCQGESIPSGGDYYEEYVARAKGLTPLRYGKQYWD